MKVLRMVFVLYLVMESMWLNRASRPGRVRSH